MWTMTMTSLPVVATSSVVCQTQCRYLWEKSPLVNDQASIDRLKTIRYTSLCTCVCCPTFVAFAHLEYSIRALETGDSTLPYSTQNINVSIMYMYAAWYLSKIQSATCVHYEDQPWSELLHLRVYMYVVFMARARRVTSRACCAAAVRLLTSCRRRPWS